MSKKEMRDEPCGNERNLLDANCLGSRCAENESAILNATYLLLFIG